MELHNETAVFISVNTKSILQPMGQKAILTFKLYYLRSTFKKLYIFEGYSCHR